MRAVAHLSQHQARWRQCHLLLLLLLPRLPVLPLSHALGRLTRAAQVRRQGLCQRARARRQKLPYHLPAALQPFADDLRELRVLLDPVSLPTYPRDSQGPQALRLQIQLQRLDRICPTAPIAAATATAAAATVRQGRRGTRPALGHRR